MSMRFKNNSGSRLANDIIAAATGITVLTGTGSNFPELTSDKDYFHVTLVGDDGDMEIIRVTKVEGDLLTCVRAQEGTVAKDWPANTRVENRITAEFLNQVATGDTIKFDQKTIKTNTDGVSAVDPAEVYGPATADTLGVVKVDNDTITIDEDGTLRSKSIPFDGGSSLIIATTQGYPNFPHVRENVTGSDSVIIHPIINDVAFVTAWEGHEFGTIGEQTVTLLEDGLYDISCMWVFLPLPIEGNVNADIELIIQAKAEGAEWAPLWAGTGKVDNRSFLAEAVTTNVMRILRKGTQLRVYAVLPQVSSAEYQVQTSEFNLNIIKLPVTNEYQVQDPSTMVFYNPGWHHVTPTAVGVETFLPMSDVTESASHGEPFAKKVSDTELEITKDGTYILVYEFSVGISDTDPNNHDIQFVIKSSKGADILASGSMHLDSTPLNGDYGSVTALRWLEAGTKLSFAMRFPMVTEYGIGYVTVMLTRLPSVTETISNNNTSGSTGSGSYVVITPEDTTWVDLDNTTSVKDPNLPNPVVHRTMYTLESPFGNNVVLCDVLIKESDRWIYQPAQMYNDGGATMGATAFGPGDGKIYVSVGQYINFAASQNFGPSAPGAQGVARFEGEVVILCHTASGGSGSTSANVKIDNTTIIKNDAKELSVNTEGLVAESGIDNFLEVVDNKLAVRGVQTAENGLWSRTFDTVSKGNANVNSEYVNVSFGDEFIRPVGVMNDPIVSPDFTAGVFTILKSGTYHISAAFNTESSLPGTNHFRIYKKSRGTTDWLHLGTGSSWLLGNTNDIKTDFDLHWKFEAGDSVLFAVTTNESVNIKQGAFVEFQLFADAALLAPALTTMHNELWQGMLRNISLGPSIVITPNVSGSSNYNVYMLLADVEHTLNEFVDPIIDYDSATGIYTVLKTGTYHFELSAVSTGSSAVSMGFAKITEDGNYNIGNSTSVLMPNSGIYNNVDVHGKLNAGDKICIITSAIQVPSVYIEFQRFADTLEHPNHGISQDAGNTAQVGSDLGIFVPAPVIPDVTPESFTGILPVEKGGTGNDAGNAVTATKLETARTIKLFGDVDGSASFDGSSDILITTTSYNTVNAQEAENAIKWDGSTKYVSTANPSGGKSGDIWFQYI